MIEYWRNTKLANIDGEVWIAVPDWEDSYMVSSFARIKSLDRYVNHWRGGKMFIKGKVLSQILRMGYLCVNLSNGNYRISKPVHQIVSSVFVENPERLPIANHEDGIKTNNLPENFKWGTISYNTQHAVDMGLIKKRFGKDNHETKLSEFDKMYIKRLLIYGAMQKDVAHIYKVSRALICRIK